MRILWAYKLLRIAFAVWATNQPFDPDKLGFQACKNHRIYSFGFGLSGLGCHRIPCAIYRCYPAAYRFVSILQ